MRSSGRKMQPYGARKHDGGMNYCRCCINTKDQNWPARGRESGNREIEEQLDYVDPRKPEEYNCDCCKDTGCFCCLY